MSRGGGSSGRRYERGGTRDSHRRVPCYHTPVAPGAFRTDFRDASSVHFPKNPMPEYDGTPAHTMIDWMKENNHKQPGDPSKAAAFLYRIATRESLLQLVVIGKDCCDASLKHYRNRLQDIESYYEDSSATAFED